MLKVALLLLQLLFVEGSALAQESAANFLDRLSVNTHMAYTDGRYSNVEAVLNDLDYLGIRHVRDGISDGARGSAPIETYIAMAFHGIRWTFLVAAGGEQSETSLKATLSLIETVARAVPRSVSAVEGTNEINNAPVTWNGSGRATNQAKLDAAVAMQKALYAMVHASSVLTGVPVAMFTGADAGGIPAQPDPGSTPGLADLTTQHPYPNKGEPPAYWVDPRQALPGASGPIIYTETGYSTNGGTSGAVDADVQARYGLDLLCDTAQFGIVRTSLYQLLDAYPAGSPQGNDGFGLFDQSGAPKPLATAIHNLTTILADTDSSISSASVPLPFGVQGMPASGKTLALRRSDGATDLIVWAEPTIWDSSSGKRVEAPTAVITLSFDQPRQTLAVFDPLVAATPIENFRNERSVQLHLVDHPLIVRLGAP